MLANVAYLAALGPAEAAASPRIASSSVAVVMGPGAAKLVAIAILISIFSAANSTALTAPRVYYAMARDGLFFKRLAEVHPRFGTPAFAIITGSIWSAITGALCVGIAPTSDAAGGVNFQDLLRSLHRVDLLWVGGRVCVCLSQTDDRARFPLIRFPAIPGLRCCSYCPRGRWLGIR